MRIYWTDQEVQDLKFYYEASGLAISEFYEEFANKYPHRTKISIEVKIGKLKLRHSKEQISQLKSRLNSGEKNGMYGKTGPNKGLTKENSTRIKNAAEKISITRKHLFENDLLPRMIGEKNGMFGKESWCKGLTKHNSDIIKIAGKKLSITLKENYKKSSFENKERIRNRMIKMSLNQNKENTIPEKITESFLIHLNIKYEKQVQIDYYSCDFVINKKIIEVQGDYWHGNPNFYNIDMLNKTQKENIRRDKAKYTLLTKRSYSFLYLWENDIKKNPSECILKIKQFLNDN